MCCYIGTKRPVTFVRRPATNYHNVIARTESVMKEKSLLAQSNSPAGVIFNPTLIAPV